MEVEYKDFIGVYTDVYPEGYCEHLVETFDMLRSNGAGWDRRTSENAKRHTKDDYSMGFSLKDQNIPQFNNNDTVNMFFSGLQYCYNDYISKYSVLENSNIQTTHMKLQCTEPGGGYHIWHFENGNMNCSNRILTFLLYLNTLDADEGGETEFLYQQRRVTPVKNTMVLWPAGFTHTHRGNTVLGDKSKYVVTGWFYIN